jgi:hypothetical protein
MNVLCLSYRPVMAPINGEFHTWLFGTESYSVDNSRTLLCSADTAHDGMEMKNCTVNATKVDFTLYESESTDLVIPIADSHVVLGLFDSNNVDEKKGFFGDVWATSVGESSTLSCLLSLQAGVTQVAS